MKKTLFLIPLLCVACGTHDPAGIRSTSSGTPPSSDDNNTGAVNSDGLNYSGYRADDAISQIKKTLGESEEDKELASQIVDVSLDPTPKTIDPTVQQQIQQVQSSQDGVPALPPLELSVQWKDLDQPLLFQGAVVLVNGKYTSNLIETSGQRPDLHMTGECDDVACTHGEFVIVDPNNHQAGIILTKDQRVLKYKQPLDPLASNNPADVPADLKQDQKVEVDSMQVVSGASNIEIHKLDNQGQTGELLYNGPLEEPDGNAVPINIDDKSSKLSSLSLIGNSGTGDILFKGTIPRLAPPQVTLAPQHPTTKPAPSTSGSKTKSSPTSSQSGQTKTGQSSSSNAAGNAAGNGAGGGATNGTVTNPPGNPPPELTPDSSIVYYTLEREDDTPTSVTSSLPAIPAPSVPPNAPSQNAPPSQTSQPPQQQQQNIPPAPPPMPPPMDSGSTTPTTPIGAAVVTPSTHCAAVPLTNNKYIAQIMQDCANPEVLKAVDKWWGPKGSSRTKLVQFLTVANQARQGTTAGLPGDFSKMADILSDSSLPVVMSFESLIESGFKATARSPSGALGWWQFLASTGRTLNPPLLVTNANSGFGDFADIKKSTNAYVTYFSSLLDDWDDDLKMAILSYEFGPAGADSVVSTKLKNKWKNDPRVPDDLKEAYSIYKDFWYIDKYYMVHKIRDRNGNLIDLSYVPKVLSAIVAGTAPDFFQIKDAKGNSVPALEMR